MSLVAINDLKVKYQHYCLEEMCSFISESFMFHEVLLQPDNGGGGGGADRGQETPMDDLHVSCPWF